MPTLHWVGKDKVVNHHHDVPFRLLDKQYTFTANEGSPANSTANRIIHGDNLEALKSLLPEFEGKVNCIYIDPPYNTGNEGWVYNDAVNDPKIKKWLGQVVGKEGEDLSRHDKWLCMMYPRLKLLHRLLADDGAIFISIDDNEESSLKLIMDEIFGAGNFVGKLIWDLPRGINAGHVARSHEYVISYAKRKNNLKLFNRSENQSTASIERCNKKVDSRHPASIIHFKKGVRYEGINKKIIGKIEGNEWVEIIGELVFEDGKLANDVSLKAGWTMKNMIEDWFNGKQVFDLKGQQIEEFFFKENGKLYSRKQLATQSIKSVLKDLPDTQIGNSEINDIFQLDAFPYAKPTGLVQHLIHLVTRSNSIILDSFAGSGTTAHAILKLNAQDGGNRRFILCEMMDYAETITAERVRRVMNGYGEGTKAVAGTGGAFDYYTVGAPLFLEDKNLNEAVGEAAIRNYVAYTESIPPAQQCGTDSAVSRYALGASDTALWLFYYEQDRITTLNLEFLASLNIKRLTKRPEHFVIYADKCALDKDFLAKHGITFKRIPRDITRF